MIVVQAADSGDLNEGGEIDKHYGHGVGAGGQLKDESQFLIGYIWHHPLLMFLALPYYVR